MYDAAAKMIYEAVVDVVAGTIDSWKAIPGRFPSYLVEHMTGVEEKVREDPRWQEAMRKRGVTDFSLAMIDPWPAGYYGAQDHYDNSALVCRPLTFMRAAPSEHGYARPVEGLIVTFDLDAMEVIDIEDHGVVALPPTAGNYSEQFMFDPNNRPAFTEFRSDVKPIEITQPDGPSFTVDGWQVSWQKWSMRIGFNPREGITLHEVTYTDRGETRPIMYRASLSEMVVPYGDTSPTHWNKNVFDMGEVGMGFSANPLTLGCDCLGEIHYFDGTVNDSSGNAVVIPNAICMHEEDYGISWKHTDFRTEEVEVRRSRRLVISMICTVGNYEYGFFWYFYNDASIEVEVKLSGVLTTGSIEDGEQPRWGKMVAPGHLRPESPALLQLPARHERRRRRETVCTRWIRFRSRTRPSTRTATRGSPRTRWWPPRPTARGTGTGRRAGTGRSPTRRRSTSSAARWPTSWCPRTWCPSWCRRAPTSTTGPVSFSTTCGSPSTTRPRGSPRATTCTSRPTCRACP